MLVDLSLQQTSRDSGTLVQTDLLTQRALGLETNSEQKEAPSSVAMETHRQPPQHYHRPWEFESCFHCTSLGPVLAL